MIAIRPVLIMAGGTGGHVFPALAVADELRVRGIPVIWLGTRQGIEARLVPQAGYAIEWMTIYGLRGKNTLSLLVAPLRMLVACWQALLVLIRRNPCVVVGMGGFVSGPGGLMAWLIRKPLLIHEQNAIPGLTNRILARLASVVMQAFPHVFKQAITTGNPVRQSISEIEAPQQRLRERQQSDQAPLHILVVGGSLGAARLNEIVPQAVMKMPADSRPLIIHQTGAKNIESATRNYADAGIEADIEAFIEDMDRVYAWADLVICRAGAMTVFELAAAGVASLLVPYPYAVDDHQTANARYLESAGAAMIVQQDELTAERLAGIIEKFAGNRKALLEMAVAARKLAIPDAAKNIANACLQAGGIV